MTQEQSRPDAATHASRPAWDETRADTEQRSGPRFTLLIRTAKLIAGSGEYLCVIRDVSQDGVKARLFHPLPGGEALAIELASGERHAVVPVWQDGEVAGFRFLAPVPMERLLADAPDGLRKRSLRLRFALPVLVFSGGRRFSAEFRDISQHGASFECGEHLAMDERVRLECDWLPPLDARVRWRRRPHYGVIFEQTFRFDELARLAAPRSAMQAPLPRLRSA